MILFLLLMHFPALPVSSIPVVLFIVVCLTDWPEIKSMLVEYKSAILLISIALIIGVLFSYRPEKSIKGVYDFLRGAVLFFPALHLVRKYPVKIQSSLVWVGFLCSLLYLCHVCFALFFVSDQWMVQRAFLTKTLGYFNTYGTSAALIVFVAIASLLFLERDLLERSVLVLTAAIGSWLLFFSGSRGSFVSLIVGVAVLTLIRFRRHFVWVLSGSGLVFLAIGAVLYFNLVGSYLQAWVRGADITSGRMEIFAATLNDVWHHAKFFGFGPNTYKYLDYGQVFDEQLYAPHSVYLEVVFSLGIVGTLLLIVAFFLLIREFIARRSFNFYPSLGLGLAVFLLVRGSVDMKLFDVYFPGTLAIAFAFMLAGKGQSGLERNSSTEAV